MVLHIRHSMPLVLVTLLYKLVVEDSIRLRGADVMVIERPHARWQLAKDDHHQRVIAHLHTSLNHVVLVDQLSHLNHR
jgi:hypothetical protein